MKSARRIMNRYDNMTADCRAEQSRAEQSNHLPVMLYGDLMI